MNLHRELLQLKNDYLKDIQSGLQVKPLTFIFIKRTKEIQDKYLTFVQEYLDNESEFWKKSEYIKHVENVLGL
jgi:hypothetical protein